MDIPMQRTTTPTGSGSGPGDCPSVIASMLSRSFSDFTAADRLFDTNLKEAAMGANGGDSTPNLDSNGPTRTPSRSPSKGRSLSDSTPKLSPAPNIRERRVSKDDQNINTSRRQPKTPRRPDFLQRGLSLQMPSGDSFGIQNPASFNRAPLSPQLTKNNTYGSPAKVLPRHSRGMDFSRACTNLHHSTLAEQSSPDSSPTVTQKGVMIPNRRMSMNTMAIDPPQFTPWSATEKSMVSNSLGSVNMFDSECSSNSDEGDDLMEPDENEDAITTPQVAKRHDPSSSTPFGASAAWPGGNFPGANPSSFTTNFHRQRMRHGRSSKSSSSASGHSGMPSPVPASPPAGKNDGYFGREVTMRGPASRRESLSMHTHDLHISSGNDSGDEATKTQLSTPGVIRRVVTRRGNLLPKIRALGRVRDELIEESMPVDAEVKREAEVIRQVRESDTTETTHSSPTLQAVNSLSEALQGIPEDNIMGMDGEQVAGFTGKGLFGTFGRQDSRSGGSKDFWNSFEQRTPPPPTFLPRGSSSTMSDDASMDSPTTASVTPGSLFPWAVPTREQTPITSAAQLQTQFQAPAGVHGPISAADGLRKVNKRRRDDDLDMQSIKRRAVSPGLSVGNSPILSQSPSQRSENLWGQPRHGRSDSISGQAGGERSNSNGSVSQQTPLLGPKRIGLQGITDMQGMAEKMSIE
ncbi:Vacuolar protein sorting-associated protein 27 [Venturia nashicola]|uniref:Vacuolar protein sorting-associated protein 27 n=1 Tax=Venturia nashicola TaxID=86259 RepID=A0A4Z1NR14_9PEZI|nr:Vacuolar protein sorting-associated protein 27 [Venturia nashicola]TLD18258.1 Vacuolar protein sorting-associated protein 27 [Venturia nashicola]